MTKVVVRTKPPYPVYIEPGCFSSVGRQLKKSNLSDHKRAFIVSQRPIAKLFLHTLTSLLAENGFQSKAFIVPYSKNSEQAKSQPVFYRLIKEIAAFDGSGPSFFLIALGGGVIGDLTGFASAVYRRGVPYIQLPTTLIAQVDSAIGGKTAIDLPEGKNLLGAIVQPKFVLSDCRVLSTLPDREWSDGFAEIVKYGIIRDPAILELLEKNQSSDLRANDKLLSELIWRCVKIKADIVSKDEFDKLDLRILLNFGHTAGHAIEAASHFSSRYSHGQAVSIGMLIACEIAENLGVLKSQHLKQRIEAILLRYHLPIFYQRLEERAILHAIGYDKKRTRQFKNRFVLPVSEGKTRLIPDVPEAVILSALKKRRK